MDIHLTPEQAVQVAQEVGAKVMLPIHWGTFNLAFHAWNEPADRALAAAKAAAVAIVIPKPGEWVEPKWVGPVETWWR